MYSGFPLPAIAHVFIDKSLEHYIVIHKITRKRILIADPAKSIIKLTPEEFLDLDRYFSFNDAVRKFQAEWRNKLFIVGVKKMNEKKYSI